jgi:serine/threonine protein kinase
MHDRQPTMPQLFEKIQRAEYAEFPEWFSPNVRDLLSNVLTVDPKDRLTIPQLKSHPWVLENMQLLASSNGRPASQSVEILEKYPPGHIAEMHTRTAKVAEKERQKYNERLNSGNIPQAPNLVEKQGSSTANGGAEIQPEKANARTEIQPEKATGSTEIQPEKETDGAEVQPEKAAPPPPRPTRTEASQQNQDLVRSSSISISSFGSGTCFQRNTSCLPLVLLHLCWRW